MKFKILFFFLLIFSYLSAQEESQKNRYISLGFSPLSLIEPKTSTLESVLEVRPFDKLAIELKYGFPLGYTHKSNNSRLDDNYYEIKTGLKYWLYRNLIFIGLEYFHVNHNYARVNNSFIENEGSIFYERANITRRVNGGRFRYGFHHTFKSGLSLEYFSGMGMRNVSIDYHSLINSQPIDSNDLFLIEEFFAPTDLTVGSKNKIDFYFGFKIAWRLFKW